MKGQPDYRYISLGAGVQSSALLVCSNLGLHDVPRANVAIFADTCAEPAWVYKQVDWLRKWSDIPVITVSAGDIMQDCIDRHHGNKKRFAALPVWTEGTDGRAVPLRRQCTKDYKIVPVQREVRRLLGYEPRQQVKQQVACMLGISVDEYHRAKPSRDRWVTNEFPLIEAYLNRSDCKRILATHNIPVPHRSACVFCPYHTDDYWISLREHFPVEWGRACEFDNQVRNMSQSGILQPVYLHRSLRPLEEAPFEVGQLTFSWDMECEGICGF